MGSNKDIQQYTNVIKSVVDRIAKSIISANINFDEENVANFVNMLKSTKRVYIVGIGKSGLVGKIFGMSLVSLGYEVYIVGETLMPAPKNTDVVIAVSGTGGTDYPIKMAQIGKKVGAKVITVTSSPNSTLANLSDLIVFVPGRSEKDGTTAYEITAEGTHGTLKGMFFEMSALALLNAVAATLTIRQKQ